MKEYGATLIITIGVITLLTTGVFSGAIYSFVCRVIKDLVNDALSRLNTQLQEVHERYCDAERLTCTRKCSKRRTGSELISFKLEQVGMTAWQEEQKRIEENTKAVEEANKEAAESVENDLKVSFPDGVKTKTVTVEGVDAHGKPMQETYEVPSQSHLKEMRESGIDNNNEPKE
jgi:hypothetical protein